MHKYPMNEREAGIIEYLNMIISLNASNCGQFARLKEEGNFYDSQALPRSFKFGPHKMCFDNSMKLALNTDLTYCEGLAYSGIIVAEHGWCLDSEGKVIDITWRTRKRQKFFIPPEDLAYFGIAFSNTDIAKSLVKNKVWGMLWIWPT